MATVHNATIAHCTLLLVSNVPVHFADNNSTMHFIRRLVLLLSDGYSHVSSVEMNRDYRYLKDSQHMQYASQISNIQNSSLSMVTHCKIPFISKYTLQYVFIGLKDNLSVSFVLTFLILKTVH